MNRYSVLRGTNKDGIYTELGYSKGLPGFLTKIGASSPSATIDAALNFLVGFTRKQGYFEEKNANNAPVSVRYAPLYLHKLPEMPNGLKPFNLLSINGLEQRDENDGADKRETVYSHNIFLEKDLIFHKGEGEYCYLDQIFGTQLTSWIDVRDNRRQVYPINLDSPPKKVTPILRLQDKHAVLAAIEAIYDNKTVAIRLEKDNSFNDRSWNMLTQIYSLLQPRLAAEIGFATYVDETEMYRLQKETSIRVFVIAPETSISSLPNNYVLLDLQNSTAFPSSNSAVRGVLEKWYRLDWRKRQEALEVLFDQDKLNYLDSDLFVQTSNGFFSDPFFTWIKTPVDRGTITTLEELYNKETEFTACKAPWCAELFEKKIPELLAPGISLESLVAQTLSEARARQSKGLELPAKLTTCYRYALSLKTTKDYSGKFYEDVAKRKDKEWQNVVEAEQEDKKQLQAKFSEERAALVTAAKSKIEQIQANCDKKVSDVEIELSTLRREKDEEIAETIREANTRIDKIRQDSITEIKKKDDESRAALDAMQQKKNEEIAATVREANTRIAQIRQDAKTEIIKKDTVIKEKDDIISRAEDEKNAALDRLRRRKDAEREAALSAKDDEVASLKDKASRLEKMVQEAQRPFKIMFFIALGVAIALLGALVFMIIRSANSNQPTEPTFDTEAVEDTEAPTEAPTEFELPDTEELTALLATAAILDQQEYTEETWMVLADAVENATAVVNDRAATQETVDEAFNRLKVAMDSLQPKPDEMDEFVDWSDHDVILNAIPEIHSIATEDIEEYIPIDTDEGARILAVFSIESDLPQLQASSDEPHDDNLVDNEPTNVPLGEHDGSEGGAANSADAGGSPSESDTENDNAEGASVILPYAVMLRGDITKELAVTAENATLVLRAGDHVVFVFGEEEMQLAAIKLLDYVTTAQATENPESVIGDGEPKAEPDSETKQETSPEDGQDLATEESQAPVVDASTEPSDPSPSSWPAETAESVDDYFLLKVGADGKWIELMDVNIMPSWWRGIIEFIDDYEQLITEKYLAQLYNINIDPIRVINSKTCKVFIFDYSDNPEKAADLAASFPDMAWQSGPYVMIQVHNIEDQVS